MPRSVREIGTILALVLAAVVVGAVNLQQQDAEGLSFANAVLGTLRLFGVLAFGPLMFVAILWAWRLLVKALATVWRACSSNWRRVRVIK